LEPISIHVVNDSMTEMSPNEFFNIIRSQIVTQKADFLDNLIKPLIIGFVDMCSQCDHRDCLHHYYPCVIYKKRQYLYTKMEYLNEA
jgi:hypothetical protein